MYGLLKEKTAIITGAAQGIGKAIAQIFAENGANVYLCDINEEKVQSAAKQIGQDTGQRSCAAKCDVMDADNVKAVVQHVVNQFGKIDLLVNSAGILIHKPMLEMSVEEWGRIFDINVKGTFIFSREAGKIMKDQKRGKIINLSSCSGKKPSLDESAYCATKSAINGFTKVCALELGAYGINVNAICPGATDTEMVRKTFLTTPEIEKEWIEKTALKRLGRPIDQARVALFLASELSDHITGECIVVSAGEMMTQ